MAGFGMKASEPPISTTITREQENEEEEEDPQLVQANKLFQTGVMLIYGQRKSIDKAIKCIQKAITFNDCDYKYWQILGEAYYQRGSLNPAINCFMKSLNLVEVEKSQQQTESEQKRRTADCIYSRLLMSDIRLSVGHLDEALNGYTEIITNDSNNVAALIGLAKTSLQLAKNSFSSSLVNIGHSQCMQALKSCLKAIKLNPHLCLTWKLASDCCLIQFTQGQRGCFESKIEEDFPGSDAKILTIDRKTCIKMATQFLCKALGIDSYQNSGCLWHNLGICLYLNSTMCQKATEREKLLNRSIKCLLKALYFDRDSSQIKNSLGVVAFNSSLLNSAQTFIIKSIQCNMSTSEIQFSNLGFMYLQKGEFRLASVAFSRCQAEEPLYARSWLGNALINNQMNLDNLSHLRHCHKLESNYHSQLMFATKVASLTCSKNYKKDFINALDCMKRLINYDNNSIEANNTLGLLHERCNHLEQSRLYFNRAYSISPQDSRILFNKLRQHRVSNSCVLTPELKDDTEFIKSTEKLINVGNREYILNFIYFLFNNGDYKNVGPKVNKYMDKLPSTDVRGKVSSQILLGLVAKAEGSDFKSWLFKNIIDLNNVICLEANINLMCLMLFGAITNDMQLVEQTLDSLIKHFLAFISDKHVQFADLFYSSDGYWLQFILLSSIFCLKDSGKIVRRILALFPTIPELWLYLGLAHIFKRTKIQTAIFCIKKANLMGSTNADLSFICEILLSIMPDCIKINYLSRAIYKYPNYQLLWESLVSSRHNELIKEKSKITQVFNKDLFNLAIEHTIKMIKTC